MKFDLDKDGLLDANDLEALLWSLNFDLSDDKILELILIADQDHDSKISL